MRVGGEGLDQHAPRLVRAGMPRAREIEQRVLVEIADRRAVAAFDVVGEDFELGLGIDAARGVSSRLRLSCLRVGLLRVGRARAMRAEEDAMRAVVDARP